MPIQKQPQVLEIVQFPDERLATKGEAVYTSIPNSEALQELLNDMEATAKHYRALGLAAIQVGVPLRAMVVWDGSKYLKMVNPSIKAVVGKSFEKEGCLSAPGLFLRVNRSANVDVQYFDENGTLQSLSASGDLSRAIQHEIDHLDGVTFLDRISSVERSSAINKLKKIKRKFKL